MAEPSPSANPSPAAGPKAPAKPAAGNPVFRMMGLPNFRARLPSRNWMIFLGVTGSFAAAVYYDRREKRRVQEKWCKAVSHIADEPLPINQMPRKVTIYLSAPPGDGLGPARQYFRDYVKPVLIAAALDYEVVESPREGDLRGRLAERIRNFRRKSGEASTETPPEDPVEEQRKRSGTEEWEGLKGDVIIGRHTWKEYMRGLHEGWLGPLDPPKADVPEEAATEPSTSAPAEDDAANSTSGTESSTAKITAEEKKETATKPDPPKPTIPSPYIFPQAYPAANLPPSIPVSFDPCSTIQFTHLLGFLKTPTRIYNYLNQRHLADQVGREAAAIALGAYRPYEGAVTEPASFTKSDDNSPSSDVDGANPQSNEIHSLLVNEEKTWHKSVHKHDDDEGEKVWLDDIVLDPRIVARMSRFELVPSEEDRATRIWEGKEGVLGRGDSTTDDS